MATKQEILDAYQDAIDKLQAILDEDADSLALLDNSADTMSSLKTAINNKITEIKTLKEDFSSYVDKYNSSVSSLRSIYGIKL